MGRIKYPIDPIIAYQEWVEMENDTNQRLRGEEQEGFMSASSAGLCYKKHFYNIQNTEKKPIDKKCN